MIQISDALYELLNRLDEIDRMFPYRIHDTVVREELAWTIRDGFVYVKAEFKLSTYYATLEEKCDLAIFKALSEFFQHPQVIAVDLDLTIPQMRLDAFQDRSVESSNGNTYDYYFGWVESLD